MSNILITGASGFIGGALSRQLSKHHKITGMSKDSIRNTGFVYIKHDLLAPSPPDIRDIDTVVHLAALTSPPLCEKNPELAYDINVRATEKLLEAAANWGVEHFVYASTGGVYGFSDVPLKEEAEAKPFDVYTTTKHEAEKICEKYKKKFMITILRYFFPYGPGMAEGQLLYRLISSVKNNKYVDINNSGKPIINPIYIDDAVEITSRICTDARVERNIQIFNIAGSEVVSIRELSENIGKLLKAKPCFRYTGKNVKNLIGDTEKINKTYNFHPMTALLDGLKKTLSWMRQNVAV